MGQHVYFDLAFTLEIYHENGYISLGFQRNSVFLLIESLKIETMALKLRYIPIYLFLRQALVKLVAQAGLKPGIVLPYSPRVLGSQACKAIAGQGSNIQITKNMESCSPFLLKLCGNSVLRFALLGIQ